MTSFGDGGFESGELSGVYWDVYSDGKGSASVSSVRKHSGTYSCKLDTGSLSYGENGTASITAYSPSARTTYEISFWVYIESGGECYWQIGDQDDTITTGTGSWQKVTIDTTDNWLSSSLYVCTYLENAGQSVIYVDDFEYVGGKVAIINENLYKSSCTGTSTKTITNPGFELGDGTGWNTDYIGSGSITAEAKRSGNYGCKLSSRAPQTKWNTDTSDIFRLFDIEEGTELDIDTFCGIRFYYKIPYFEQTTGYPSFRVTIHYYGGPE